MRHVGGPVRTGEDRVAAQQLPVQDLLVFEDLNRAILQWGQHLELPALPFSRACG